MPETPLKRKTTKRGRPIDSSPINSQKRHKDTSDLEDKPEETFCAICHEIILEGEEGQDAVFCEGKCEAWIHRKCSGLTSEAFERICESEDKYLCPFCMLFMQNCELTELRKLIKSLGDKIEKLLVNPPASDNVSKVNDSVCTPLLAKSSTSSHSNHPPADITATVTQLMNEEKEKEKRKLNVIIHNLPECNDPDPSNRKNHDISKVSSIIDKHLSVPTNITQAIRIGKKREKPRLLKITLNSAQQKAAVLRNCTKLRSSNIPEDVRKIYVTPDLTPKEQELNKCLRSQLSEKNKDGKQFRIKNGKIVRRSGT